MSEAATVSANDLRPGMRMVFPCSCVNIIDKEWGIQKALIKCMHHKQESGKLGIAHHEEMGAIIDGKAQSDKYIDELVECLKEIDGMPPRRRGSHALEIGCGVGVYIRWLRGRGYNYLGLEPDQEVAAFAQSRYGGRGVGIMPKSFNRDFIQRTGKALILACHVFEHMPDAPEMMQKCYHMLERGGRLILIVPNDEDPVNGDHLFFFNETTLRRTLERCGFKDVRMTTRRRIEREKFIYAVGFKQ